MSAIGLLSQIPKPTRRRYRQSHGRQRLPMRHLPTHTRRHPRGRELDLSALRRPQTFRFHKTIGNRPLMHGRRVMTAFFRFWPRSFAAAPASSFNRCHRARLSVRTAAAGPADGEFVQADSQGAARSEVHELSSSGQIDRDRATTGTFICRTSRVARTTWASSIFGARACHRDREQCVLRKCPARPTGISLPYRWDGKA